jgi:hypothetical protein
MVRRVVSKYAAMLFTFQPSLWRRMMTSRRSAGSSISANGGYRRPERLGSRLLMRTRRTVWELGRRPEAT